MPKATIKRHADGKNVNANELKVLRRLPTFTSEMEEMLKNHLLKFEETFFGFTIKDVRKLAFGLAEKMAFNIVLVKRKNVPVKNGTMPL